MGVGPMEQEEVTASSVGRRVACDGERATVLYVGPIPRTAGENSSKIRPRNHNNRTGDMLAK